MRQTVSMFAYVSDSFYTEISHQVPPYWKEQQEPEGKVRVSAVWRRDEVRAAPVE